MGDLIRKVRKRGKPLFIEGLIDDTKLYFQGLIYLIIPGVIAFKILFAVARLIRYLL